MDDVIGLAVARRSSLVSDELPADSYCAMIESADRDRGAAGAEGGSGAAVTFSLDRRLQPRRYYAHWMTLIRSAIVLYSRAMNRLCWAQHQSFDHRSGSQIRTEALAGTRATDKRQRR